MREGDPQGEHADERVALLLGTGKRVVEIPMGDRALIRPGVIASGPTVAATLAVLPTRVPGGCERRPAARTARFLISGSGGIAASEHVA
jgi:hypothetical protein